MTGAWVKKGLNREKKSLFMLFKPSNLNGVQGVAGSNPAVPTRFIVTLLLLLVFSELYNNREEEMMATYNIAPIKGFKCFFNECLGSDIDIFCYSVPNCITSTGSYNWTISTDYKVRINDLI